MLFRDGPTLHEDGLSYVRNQPGEQNVGRLIQLCYALLDDASRTEGLQFSQVKHLLNFKESR